MSLLRGVLLAASESRWLRERAPRYGFVRAAVKRFMPGERLDDAIEAAVTLKRDGIATVLTRLGENVTDRQEADEVTRHYLEVLDRARAIGFDCQISVKLTQLGLDVDREQCEANLRALVERAAALGTFVWIDMEQSACTDATLELYRRMRAERPNVGVCVQAYLHRTARDLEDLIPIGAGVRLVKGAYLEPRELAFPKKPDVDASFLTLARRLLSDEARRAGVTVVFGTHDARLIRDIQAHAASRGLAQDAYEFDLLYGIQRGEQVRLARAGYRVRVLISYGSYWVPWYLRRLAERPANVLFVVRSLFRN